MATTKKNEAQKVKAAGFCLAGLKVDETKAKEGILFDFMGGSKLLIAKGNESAHARYISNYYKEHETEISKDTEDSDKVAQKGFVEAAARHRLIGWEGVVDENGEEVPYSVEQAEEYLSIDEIFEFVQSKVNDRSNWRVNSTQQMGEELKK